MNRAGAHAPTLWETYDALLRRATSIIGDSADALNAINVFPVPDADTGSNLKLTMTGISEAVPNLEPASLDSAVQAAILCAHGNSGAIVAEMFVSVCRTLEYDLPALQAMPAGTLIATLLQSAAAATPRRRRSAIRMMLWPWYGRHSASPTPPWLVRRSNLTSWLRLESLMPAPRRTSS